MSRTSSSPALLAELVRGPAVESRHLGHAVVVTSTGETLFAAGDPDHLTFPRSSLKPLQALAALARGTDEAFEMTDPEVAITCASHQSEPRHRETVQCILDKIGASESDLRCGPHPVVHVPTREALIRAGQTPTRIFSNCSGKHAGMLALARVLNAPTDGYWLPDHPVQKEIQRVLVEVCGSDPASLRWGADGCGVPNYLVPLSQLALGFARLVDPSGLKSEDVRAAKRITSAMMAAPEMVRGEGGFDTVLMTTYPGRVVSKVGAEGCVALGLPGKGIGIAVKIEDGAQRPLAPVALSLLRRLEAIPDPVPAELAAFAAPAECNTCGETVGQLRSCL